MCDNNISVSRLRELIDSSGKTRENIAKELGCDTSTVTKHYNGDRKITVDYIIKYAKYFNVSSDYLLGLSDAQTNDKNIQSICDYTGLSEKSVLFLNEIKRIISSYSGNIQTDYREYYFNVKKGISDELSKCKQADIYLKLINFIIEDTYRNGNREYSGYVSGEGCLLQRIYGFFSQHNTDDTSATRIYGGTMMSFKKMYEYGYLYEISEYVKKCREIYTSIYSNDFPIPEEESVDDELPF